MKLFVTFVPYLTTDEPVVPLIAFITLFLRKKTKAPKNLIYEIETEGDEYVVFPWDRYEYKGRRFDISTFNEEVEELPNLQCNCCGNSYFQPYINIMLICKKCYKEYSK